MRTVVVITVRQRLQAGHALVAFPVWEHHYLLHGSGPWTMGQAERVALGPPTIITKDAFPSCN